MKKNVVIVILVILLLGLGGYLVYDKVIDKNKKENKVEQTETNTSKENNYNKYANNLAHSIEAYYKKEEIGERNVWKEYSFNDVLSEYYKSYLSVELRTDRNVYLKFLGESPEIENEKNILSKYGKEYKLIEDAIDLYLVPTGNSGQDISIYIIKHDGSLARFSYTIGETNEFKIEKNYKNLKNIVNITYSSSFGSIEVYATDINGNSNLLN